MNAPNAPPGGETSETHIEVRYVETDQMGCAHHSACVAWFELGRVAWMREHAFPYRKLEADGVLMPVIGLNARYLLPARFEDRLVIQTSLAELGRGRVVFENRIQRIEAEPQGQRTLLIEGRVELACIGRDGRVQRLPKELLEHFAQFLKREAGSA